MCIINVESLQKLNMPNDVLFRRSSSYRKVARKHDSLKCKIFQNDCDYKFTTSPNRPIRMGITDDGRVDVWGSYMETHGPNTLRMPSVIRNPDRIFCGQMACAAITADKDVWIWGLLPWHPSVSIWFLERQKSPIHHIDFCVDHLLVTNQNGSVMAIDDRRNTEKHRYLDSMNDVLMTSSYYSSMMSYHTIFLRKSGSVMSAGVDSSSVCMVPRSGVFAKVEAYNNLCAGLTVDGRIKLWGNNGDARFLSNWAIPWKVSDESIMEFAMEYGSSLTLRRLPRRIRRTIDFKSMRMLQKMAMN